ncbi:MAG: hypothetical protein ABSC18_10995, partial [Verrucomicrobiota bacterium]
MEAEVLPPPPAEGLERIVKALELTKGSKDFETFYDLAAKGRDEVPADVAEFVKENDLIPAMLRTVENENVT